MSNAPHPWAPNPNAKCQICMDTGVVSTGSELDRCPFCDAGKQSAKPVAPDAEDATLRSLVKP